jgi:hypothetical protein
LKSSHISRLQQDRRIGLGARVVPDATAEAQDAEEEYSTQDL